MLVKRLAACMYPSIFNNFPVIQAVSLKVHHFSTFVLHILASPGYAPWTIVVNVTWIEREFRGVFRGGQTGAPPPKLSKGIMHSRQNY